MPSLIQKELDARYDWALPYRSATDFENEGLYSFSPASESARPRHREQLVQDLDPFAELEQIESESFPSMISLAGYHEASPISPLVLASPATREQATELLALLPEELSLLAERRDRLSTAIRTRQSLREERITRLAKESTSTQALANQFAQIPPQDASAQQELRRTHLEKLLDAQKDRIDTEERSFERDLLSLEAQLDETEREYMHLKQLSEIIKE